jgi:membrane-associated protease RseP (regulator of RpoE activity)
MAFTLTPELTFLIGLAVFWAILYLIARLFHLDKHGLDVKPAYFMYRSKALNSSIDKLAKKQPALWKTLSNIGVAFSIGLMAFAFYFLINNLLRFSQVGDIGYVAPVIPGLTLSITWLPFFLVAVVVIVLPHELAHGIMARVENIPVLSTGILALLVFFGAFVEPDEKEFEKASLTARLRMLSAGSATNLVTALLALILLTGLFAPPAGLLIQETMPDGPLENAGLGRWDAIQAINGTSIATYPDFSKYMRSVEAGQNLSLTVLHNNQVESVLITTASAPENKSRAIIGLNTGLGASYQPNRLGLDQYTGVNLYWTIFWIYVFAFSLAVFNMLPLYPFDGERVLYYPLERFVKKRKRELRISLSAFTLALFALNIIISIWRYGLIAI